MPLFEFATYLQPSSFDLQESSQLIKSFVLLTCMLALGRDSTDVMNNHVDSGAFRSFRRILGNRDVRNFFKDVVAQFFGEQSAEVLDVLGMISRNGQNGDSARFCIPDEDSQDRLKIHLSLFRVTVLRGELLVNLRNQHKPDLLSLALWLIL